MQQLETALKRLMVNEVNLDPAVTTKGRNDRDWLVDRILELPAQDPAFPLLDPDFPRIHFGSFARRTKIKPLDDIDLMVVLNAQNTKYRTPIFENHVTIRVPRGSRLENFLHPNTHNLNSRLVVNQLIRSLSRIPRYQTAELHRNGAAAIMRLKKHPWTYDIVPTFRTAPWLWTPSRFLIPDGQGHWKFTDPTVDQNRATQINQQHDGRVLEMVRLVKHWNRQHGPTISSYLLETLVLNWYDVLTPCKNPSRCEEFAKFLQHLKRHVRKPVRDPKGLQSDINTIPKEQRRLLSQRAEHHAHMLELGNRHAKTGEVQQAMKHYQTVFGPQFGR